MNPAVFGKQYCFKGQVTKVNVRKGEKDNDPPRYSMNMAGWKWEQFFGLTKEQFENIKEGEFYAVFCDVSRFDEKDKPGAIVSITPIGMDAKPVKHG